MKKLLQQAIDALEHAEPWLDGLMAQDKVRSVIGVIAAELSKPEPSPPNKVTSTAPETIYLCVSDDKDDANENFQAADALLDEGVTWCRDEAIDVCVKYTRADLAGVKL